MADITKIVLPDNTEYDVKDAGAVHSTTTTTITTGISSDTFPTNPTNGDIFYHRDLGWGYIYDNGVWHQIAPKYESGSFTVSLWGDTGTIYWVKWGSVATIRLFKDFSTARTNFTQDYIGTLPEIIRPEYFMQPTVMAFINSNNWSTGTYYPCILWMDDQNGRIGFRGNTTEMKKCMGFQWSVTYQCNHTYL